MAGPRTSFKNVAIESLVYDLPPRNLTSTELEDKLAAVTSRLKLPPRPIEALTGIVERRLWEPGTHVHEVAANVARKAIETARVPIERVGVLINTSVCKDYLEPSMASLIHGDLKLPAECQNFDIANACLGFLNGMELAGRLIESGDVDYAVIVDGESSGGILDATIERLSRPEATAQDFWQNFATLTLGSAAVAMVLTHAKLSQTTHRLNGAVTLADTSQNRLCLGTADRMVTESTRLLKAGVNLSLRTWELAARHLLRWTPATIQQFICHQVGKPHTVAICQALGIDLEKVFMTFPTLGNVGPAAVPLTLAMAEEAGRLRQGDHVGLMGIGSGLNVTMMSVTW